MDTHAHGAALASNWRVVELTGEVVDVHGFSKSLKTMKDIPIVMAASIYVCPKTGREYLLIIDQAMYFGTLMDHSLINPNQIRQFGHSLCDDPYDPHRDLQLEADNSDLVVPFESDGPDIYFETRAPTDEELVELADNKVVLTGPSWNPSRKNLLSQLGPIDRSERALEQLRMVQCISLGCCVTNEDKSMRQQLNGNYSGSMVRHLSQISTAFDEGAAMELLTEAVNYTEADIQPEEQVLELPQIDFDSFHDYKAMAIAQVQAQVNREKRSLSAIRPTSRHSSISTEHLAKTFMISRPKAQQLQRITTQKGVRRGIGPMERRLRDLGPSLNKPKLGGHWYGDILHSKITSLDQNNCAFMWTNDDGFKKVYPMETKDKDDCAFAYTQFKRDVGIPGRLTTDLEPAMVGRKTPFKKAVNSDGVDYTMAERGRKNQNWAAELSIGLLRRRWNKFKRQLSIPDRLWDFGLVHLADLDNFLPGKNGRSRWENVRGFTPDIAKYCDFMLFDLCNVLFEGENCLGRWLGVSHRIGNRCTYWILRETGQVIATSNVTHLTVEEWQDPRKQDAIKAFNAAIDTALSPDNHVSKEQRVHGRMLDDVDTGHALDPAYGLNTPSGDDYQTPEALPHVDDIIDGDSKLDHDSPFDQLIGMEIQFDAGDGTKKRGKVKKRKLDDYGNPLGIYNKNIFHNHAEYIVEMLDGSEETFLANQIAENMFCQMDSEGNQFLLLEEIIDHKKDKSAIPIEDGFIMTKSGNKVAKKTTRGWKLLAKFKDGSMEWLPLKDLKDSYPVELAEYAVGNALTHEPAFNWWVRKVLRKRDRIISKVKSRYWKTTHKYGCRVPKSVEEALEIDKETGTDYWSKAIEKEMKKAKIAWYVDFEHTPEEVRKGKVPGLIGFQEIRCHIVFDVKMDLTRKARFCANGNEATAPASTVYSSVVSRDSIRIAFLVAGLNGLELKAADVTNAYLNAPTKEKIWFVGGLECGEGHGKVCVLTRALYGLRGSGNAWRSFFSKTLEQMNFESTKADRDVWIRPAVTRDGQEYYEMVCVYVDDILVISKDPDAILTVIQDTYELKGGGGATPTTYLGASISKVQFKDGSEYWAMSPNDYLQNALNVVEDLLARDGHPGLTGRSAKTPMPLNYRPELDNSKELNAKMASRYLQLIGIARWAVELGALDIYLEVSILSHHQALPRKGHLDALYHLFAYIKNVLHPKGNVKWKRRVVFDGADPVIDRDFLNAGEDWKEFYPDAEEEMPPNRPKPRGKAVAISCFVDANHAGNVVTRRSHTGILIYVQNAPIIWFSKRQNTVETSTFGSEFIAMQTAKELVVALRYKLRMFGVPIKGPYDEPDGPAIVHCDNAGVVANTTIPTSTLTKKHNSINYHACREAVAAGIMIVSKEDTEYNHADLFTKVLNATKRLLFRKILY